MEIRHLKSLEKISYVGGNIFTTGQVVHVPNNISALVFAVRVSTAVGCGAEGVEKLRQCLYPLASRAF